MKISPPQDRRQAVLASDKSTFLISSLITTGIWELSHIACNRLYKHHSLPATIVAVIHPIAAAEVVAWAYLIRTVDKGKGVIVKLVRTGPMLNPV